MFSSTPHHRARHRLESKSPPRLRSWDSAATNAAHKPSAPSPAGDRSLGFKLFPLAGHASRTAYALGQRYFCGGERSLAPPARTPCTPWAPERIPQQRFCDPSELELRGEGNTPGAPRWRAAILSVTARGDVMPPAGWKQGLVRLVTEQDHPPPTRAERGVPAVGIRTVYQV